MAHPWMSFSRTARVRPTAWAVQLADHTARAELTFVRTDDGKEGYSYYRELLPGPGTNSERSEPAFRGEPYRVAVYEPDGVSLVGYQTVNRPVE